MLYYNRIAGSKGTNFDETRAWKEFSIFHYWRFLHKGFKLQVDVCNGCNDVLIMSLSLRLF